MPTRPALKWTYFNLGHLETEGLLVLGMDPSGHTASALLDIGHCGIEVELSVNPDDNLLTITARLNNAGGDVTDTVLLRLQERGRLTRMLPDHMDGVLMIQAASYCPGTKAIAAVARLLTDDIREVLSGGHLAFQRPAHANQ